MKKFQFTLQKLMDYREQELDRQKNTLNALRGELNKIEAAAAELHTKVIEESAELERVCAQGAQAYEISVRKRYIVTLQQEIHLREAQAVQKRQEIDAQLGIVVDATKDVKTLEKLEEKQLEEYKTLENKEHEQFIEEFVSNASLRTIN
ncbi:MAG: flagellar export protein FliJ [Oscillospiraceae bacterium]